MTLFSNVKKNSTALLVGKIMLAAALVGFLSSVLALSLKKSTEYFESAFLLRTENNLMYLLAFPIMGLSVIYFLRQYVFKKKANKGITEIFEATNSKSKHLPLYKIPSHFINGLLTVAFGGSTGIEVSTVVATAAIGNTAQRKKFLFKRYKTELICAGITAGITILFNSPIAGILFSMEVIARKTNKVFFLTNIIALSIAGAFLIVLNEEPLFDIAITNWHLYPVPDFILLELLPGVNSV